MEDISKYIATVSKESVNDITNNAEIIINNIKILIKKKDDEELHITKNHIINFKYDENLTQIELNYYDNKSYKIYIRFDEQSESAYKSMIQKIKDFSKVKGVLYYSSGNFKMEGEFILDEENGRYSANGNAKVYYDKSNKQLYYEGEIENEMFDGSGMFYNKGGHITLSVKNIDQNNPIGDGLLIIKNYYQKTFYEKTFSFDEVDEIDFNDFDLDSFVKNNNKIEGIFEDLNNYSKFEKDYYVDNEVSIELESQRNMTNDKKYEALYRKTFELELKMDEMMKMVQEIHKKITTQPKRVGFFS
tara:strand:+ start:1289 stop:2194 length:906 start_codon:yes stop_codon:yes gene_type:complete